jgi:hypothetical protein
MSFVGRWGLCVFVALFAGMAGCKCNPSPAEKPAAVGSGFVPPKITKAVDPVDNGRCHVCHINYYDELLAAGHAQKGVSCEACHGPSNAHCGDENNITAPDKMYGPETIDPGCANCHDFLTLTASNHGLYLIGELPDKKFCVDCHGKHKLPFRNRHWDKTTGKLL